MKSRILLLLGVMLLSVASTSAQKKKKYLSQYNPKEEEVTYFYENIDDYKNNKPIKGIRWWQAGYRLVKDDGELIKKKHYDWPANLWTTWTFGYGVVLVRSIEGKEYYVHAIGAYCYYRELVSSHGGGPKFAFYSKGWNGELKMFSNKDFKTILQQYGLREEYERAYETDVPKTKLRTTSTEIGEWLDIYRSKYYKLLNEAIDKTILD